MPNLGLAGFVMPNRSDKAKKRSTSFDVNPTFDTAPFKQACTGACLRPHFFMEPSDISGASMRRNVLMNAWENAVCVFVCLYLSLFECAFVYMCVFVHVRVRVRVRVQMHGLQMRHAWTEGRTAV